MMHSADSRKICEAALMRHRKYNIEHNIYKTHIRIIDRMLERRLELLGVYEEIYVKLDGVDIERDLFVFFDSLLCIASTWNPDEVAKSREGRRKIRQVNKKIAKVSEELANLLDERDVLNEHSGFCSDTHYDICQVIEDSSEHNGHFNGWVRSRLASLKSQFDMKYWPSLADCIRTIDADAGAPVIQPSNSTTAAATSGERAGDADFFKAFDCRLREEGFNFEKLAPSRLKLSDASFAALASCALDRKDEDMFDADYIKRFRQRERASATSSLARP